MHFGLLAASISLLLVSLCNTVMCEMFTAMSDVEKLLNTEKILVESLERYINMEEERIDKIKRLKEMYAKQHNASKGDSEAFLSNPVNAFLLVKHMSSDWNATMRLIDNTESQGALTYLLLRKNLFPSKEDLEGAAEALMRLQQFYLLDASTVASGNIKGLGDKSPELTASDCFEIGQRAYDVKWSNFSLMWMEEALKRLDSEEIHKLDKTEIMEYIAYTSYEVGNFTYGLKVTEEITKLNSDYPRLFDNLKYYQTKSAERDSVTNSQDTSAMDALSYKGIDVNGDIWTERQIVNSYESLCRGESVQSQDIKNKLHCYYETNNNSYFLVAPIKVEILSFDPRIVMFHNVITEKEMNITRNIAAPMLQRAVVQDAITGEIQATNDRISKSTCLEDYQHRVVARINRRIEDVSGLTVKTAEAIHIINYGIGGHYEPHFDFSQIDDTIEMFRRTGNRMATWIYYMSDVAAGGFTVFPIIGVQVKPIKGSAAFWFNLRANGKGDKRTLHAACPVLSGSKWVGNKWLHAFENEFRRPCSLDSEK